MQKKQLGKPTVEVDENFAYRYQMYGKSIINESLSTPVDITSGIEFTVQNEEITSIRTYLMESN